MIRKLARAFAAICVGTVLTQLILLGYFAFKGTLHAGSMTQVIGLLNGIDITGARLQRILSDGEDREQPDFDEILEARKMQSYDMDLRLQSQQTFRNELGTMLADLRDDRQRLDLRLGSFNSELDQIEQEALKKGLRDAGRAIQVLDAEAAKDQLLIMFNEKRVDDVVTIIQAMPLDKRRDILAEFTSEAEKETLAELLRLISEGRPTTALIDAARSNR